MVFYNPAYLEYFRIRSGFMNFDIFSSAPEIGIIEGDGLISGLELEMELMF